MVEYCLNIKVICMKIVEMYFLNVGPRITETYITGLL